MSSALWDRSIGGLRATLRLVAIVCTTTPLVLVLLVGIVLRSACPRPGWALFHWGLQLWGQVSARILGVRLTIEGRPPEPPFFLVANHLSYLDIPILHGLLHGHFLSKAEIAHWPLAGPLARLAGTLFVDRNRRRDLTRVLPALHAVLTRGGGVIVFPEATSSSGAEILPFKPSLFEVAIDSKIPVSYAALSYVTPLGSPPAHLSVCWWGDMPFGSHFLKLLTLPAIHARVAFGDTCLTEDDRKRLAVAARAALLERFEPSAPVPTP